MNEMNALSLLVHDLEKKKSAADEAARKRADEAVSSATLEQAEWFAQIFAGPLSSLNAVIRPTTKLWGGLILELEAKIEYDKLNALGQKLGIVTLYLHYGGADKNGEHTLKLMYHPSRTHANERRRLAAFPAGIDVPSIAAVIASHIPDLPVQYV